MFEAINNHMEVEECFCVDAIDTRNEAYENSRIHKENTKKLHDPAISRKTFVRGEKVLLHKTFFWEKCVQDGNDPSLSLKFSLKVLWKFKTCQM